MWNVHASGRTKDDVLKTVEQQLRDSPDDEREMVLSFIQAKVDKLTALKENQSIDVYSSGSGIVATVEVRTVNNGLPPKADVKTTPPQVPVGAKL